MKKDIKNLNKFTSDFIVSSKGQLDYPGMNTLIPNANGRITMKGVKQNVLGIDDLGNKKIMKPKGEYQFPGDSVYEIPLKKKGGEFKKSLVSNPKKTKKSLASKKYSRSLSATNVLFTENSLFKKPKSRKNKVYNPNAKYYEKGGALLTKKVTCKKCGWKWDAEDGGNDITTCHECGGQGLVHAQGGGNTDAMTGMMKARLAYANEFGNPAAERMINLPDNPYQFDNGDTGTHYMASMDNYAVPQIQDENGVLQLGDYGPESNEAIRFDSDEDANYFAENYKDVSPGFINQKQYGGLNKFVEGGSSSCSKDEVWDKYSKKCVKVYTLANDKKFIDGVGNWAMHSNDPDKISFEYNDQIKHYLYSGKYGYDPVSGTLYPLKKEQKTIADVETKKILAKQENKATYTQSIIDAGFDPDTFGKSKGTNVITGEKIYGDKSQEDVNEINKEAINNFVTEGHKKAILDSPFNTAAFFTPSGIAAGVMQGAANLVPDTYDFGKDPSWSGAGAIAMDALMMSPTFKNLGKFLKVPKQLPGSPNSFELFDLNNVRKPSGSIGNQGATPESANKILQSLGIKVKGKIPNEVSLKEMVEHLKNNPKDALKYKKFLENKPINVSELPGGEYQINDGHHRATLSYYSGNENIPAIIKNKGEYITQLPNSPNVVSSVDDVQKAGFLNPLALIDRVTPRFPAIPTTFPLGMEDDVVNWSPLNLIPGYGKKLAEPGFAYPINSGNTEITAYRKFGNSLDDLINSKTFRPQGGFRMGADQIKNEGNWAEAGIANENYKGVFAAGMNPRVEGTNIQLQNWNKRNGVVGMTKQGNPAIPITDPGLSFHRRLPFSNRYVPIDKQKLIDNKFQLATQLPHVQSLIEKYGIAAAYALTFGYLANGKEGAIENLKTVNKYSIDPIKNWSKKAWDELETTLNEKQYGGITKFDDGGTVYTVKGSKGYYKKVNGQWQVDWNRSGKYQPLSKGDVKARTAVLNKMAKPAYDKDYDEMVAYKNLSTKDKINKFEPKKEATKEELKKVSERLGRDYKPEDTKLQSVNMVYPEKYIIGPGGGLLNQGLKTGVGAIEKLAATKIPGLFGTTVGQAAGAGFAADALVNQFPGAISDIGKGEYEDAAEKALYGTLGLAGSGIGKGIVSEVKGLGKFLDYKEVPKQLPGSPNIVNDVPKASYFTTLFPRFDIKNLKTKSGKDWIKKWYSDPDFIKKYKETGKIYPEHFQDEALETLSKYEDKNYIDLIKDKGLVTYIEELPSTGLSYGTPNRIYVKNSAYYPFNKFGKESTRVHELTHLLEKNGYFLSDADKSELLKPFIINGVSKDNGTFLQKLLLENKKDYYLHPSEIHARMNQARFHFDLSPGDKFTKEMANEISKLNDFNGMTRYIQDKKAFMDLMNNFWSTPAAVTLGAAGAAGAADLTKKQYKQGGATNDYVELDLTPEEIQKYIDGGYIVEEIN